MNFRLNLAILCIALVFVFSSTVAETSIPTAIPVDEKYDPLLDVPLTPGYLIYLAKGEIDVWRMLAKYQNDTNAKKSDRLKQVLDGYLQDFANSSLMSNTTAKRTRRQDWLDAVEVVKNPIALFRMTRRFVIQLKVLRTQLNEEMSNKITELLGAAAYPTVDDHMESMESLLNIQQFYDTKPLDLARGQILTVSTPVTLTAQHALEIGILAREMKLYTLALPWLQAAETLNYANSGGKLISNEEVALQIASLVQAHDIAYDKELAKGLFFFEEKMRYNISARTMREIKMNNYWGIRPSSHESYDSDFAYYNLLNICNGRGFVPESVKKTLYCYLERRKHPYFFINPIKIEIFSHDPYTVMMHKAIPKYLFQDLWARTAAISAANASLPASILNLNHPQAVKENCRDVVDPREGVKHRILPSPQKTHFADHHLGPVLVNRIEILTGMNVEGDGSDLFVVNSYMHGNPVTIHCDHLFGLNDADQDKKGHRLSSIMIYMTTVEEGGGTAFPNLGFRVFAEAGSMLYWYGAHPNSEIDFRTAHEGCYSALGLRWVGVKFIRQWANFNKQKCSTKLNQWLMD